MIIHVERISNGVIYGSTHFGSINVKWIGAKPVIDKTYYVELDIEDTLVWEQDVMLSCSSEIYNITCDGITISLFGVLESVDDDGYSVLRMGDFIIPFLAQGNPFCIGSKIEVIIDSIAAYPVNNYFNQY